MLPVSAMHFLVSLAYLVLGLGALKVLAIRYAATPAGKASPGAGAAESAARCFSMSCAQRRKTRAWSVMCVWGGGAG